MSKDRQPSDEPAERPAPSAGPVLSPMGTILPVPHALTSGRPRPEPEERWTLGMPPTGDAPHPTSDKDDRNEGGRNE
jgi:hypothetical protein